MKNAESMVPEDYIGKKFYMDWKGKEVVATVSHISSSENNPCPCGVYILKKDNPGLNCEDEDDSVPCAGWATTISTSLLREINEDEPVFIL